MEPQNSTHYKFLDEDKLLPWLEEMMKKDKKHAAAYANVKQNVEIGLFSFQRGGE
jgi:hypothetical protein